MKKYIRQHKRLLSAVTVFFIIVMSVFCIDSRNDFSIKTFAAPSEPAYGSFSDILRQPESDSEYGDSETDTESEYIITTEYPDEPGRAPDIVSNAAIVIDASTGNILYDKNASEKKYPASITKIMTCYLALKNSSFDEKVTMSYDAIWGIDRDSSHIALDVDETISMKDALYALMLESANEVAWGIGEHITNGSITDFTELMNKTAKELGCNNTHFNNANGLSDKNHYTTCYDMALITQAALTLDDFRTITSTENYSVAPTNLCDVERPLNQHCKMIMPYSTYYYEYCEGGKTGYTEEANNTLVTWAKKGDTELICVVMDCMGSWNCYTDSKALFEYCFNSFEHLAPDSYYEFTDSDKAAALSNLNSFYNKNDTQDISLSIEPGYYISAKSDWNIEDIKSELVYNTDILYNAENGMYDIGNIIFTYEGNTIGQASLLVSGYNNSDNEKDLDSSDSIPAISDTKDNKKHSLKFVIIFIIVLVAVVLAYIAYSSYIRKQRRAKSLARKREYEKRLAQILEDIDDDL